MYRTDTILKCLITALFAVVVFSQKPDCLLDKNSGNGKGAIQKFYYNNKWHSCFGFKYTGKGGNGNKFASYSECMSECAMADGSMCSGPSPSKFPAFD